MAARERPETNECRLNAVIAPSLCSSISATSQLVGTQGGSSAPALESGCDRAPMTPPRPARADVLQPETRTQLYAVRSSALVIVHSSGVCDSQHVRPCRPEHPG